MLWDYWGIQGHETAIKEMRSLIDEGMRASYRRKMELLSHKYKDATEVQLIEEARKTEDKNDPKSMTAERWKLYEQLWQGKKPFQGSPYLAVPFDQLLSKEVITNEYGILPEYQKYYNHG